MFPNFEVVRRVFGEQILHPLVVDFQVGNLHLVRCSLRHLEEHRFADPRYQSSVMLAAHHCVSLPTTRLPVRKDTNIVPVKGILHHILLILSWYVFVVVEKLSGQPNYYLL